MSLRRAALNRYFMTLKVAEKTAIDLSNVPGEMENESLHTLSDKLAEYVIKMSGTLRTIKAVASEDEYDEVVAVSRVVAPVFGEKLFQGFTTKDVTTFELGSLMPAFPSEENNSEVETEKVQTDDAIEVA